MRDGRLYASRLWQRITDPAPCIEALHGDAEHRARVVELQPADAFLFCQLFDLAGRPGAFGQHGLQEEHGRLIGLPRRDRRRAPRPLIDAVRMLRRRARRGRCRVGETWQSVRPAPPARRAAAPSFPGRAGCRTE